MLTCAALCHTARARVLTLIVISFGVFPACGGDSKDSRDGASAARGGGTSPSAGHGGGNPGGGTGGGPGGAGGQAGRAGTGAQSGQGGGKGAQGGAGATSGHAGVSGNAGASGAVGGYTSCPPSMTQNAPCTGSFRCDYQGMCTACGCCSSTVECRDGKLEFLGSSDGCFQQCGPSGGAAGVSGRGGAGAGGMSGTSAGEAAGEGGA